jgi:hypothetical protein
MSDIIDKLKTIQIKLEENTLLELANIYGGEENAKTISNVFIGQEKTIELLKKELVAYKQALLNSQKEIKYKKTEIQALKKEIETLTKGKL